MKKYEFTGETKVVNGVQLHRIRATRDFNGVSKGELGGWIATEDNLSHDGDAWVFGDAKVYGNAQVSGAAWVYGNAKVYGNAEVSGDAWVWGDAKVSGNAQVFGDAEVYGNAQVYAQMFIRYGHVTKKFKALNDPQLILASLNILPTKTRKGEDVYTLYKRVYKTDLKKGQYTSWFDSGFIYNIGKVVSQEITTNDPEVSCSQGIHLSTPTYWDEGNALIECRVLAKDIYTCMAGKIRATQCKVVREVKEIQQ
jgi:hypothetical protein